MNTTTGVFGHATAFSYLGANGDVVSDHVGAIRRQLQGIFIQGGQGSATTSPKLSIFATLTGAATEGAIAFSGLHSLIPATMDVSIPVRERTVAQDLLDFIHDRSGLIMEEISTLMRTTRRTLQNWRAGEPISAVNEHRLRGLADAVDCICTESPAENRRRLFEKANGEVRLFDLLAEGRIELAKGIYTGAIKRTPAELGNGVHPDIAARLSPAIDVTPLTQGVVSSRRLRRHKKD